MSRLRPQTLPALPISTGGVALEALPLKVNARISPGLNFDETALKRRVPKQP